MSESMIWYLIYLILAVGAGIFVYRKTSSPWFTLIAVILMMGIGVTLNLIALMIVILFIIIGVSIMHTGERR